VISNCTTTKPPAGLPFRGFALPLRHELFDETGTIGSLYRRGIVADRVDGKMVSNRASGSGGGSGGGSTG